MDLKIKTYIRLSRSQNEQIEDLHNGHFVLSPWSENYLKKFFSKKDQFPVVCVLEEKGNVRGYVLGKFCEKKDDFLIHSFLISQDLRGKGWGKKIMQSMVYFLEKNSEAKNIIVNFRNSNPVGNFYKSFGFSDPEVRGNYKNGEQKISMRMKI